MKTLIQFICSLLKGADAFETEQYFAKEYSVPHVRSEFKRLS